MLLSLDSMQNRNGGAKIIKQLCMMDDKRITDDLVGVKTFCRFVTGSIVPELVD